MENEFREMKISVGILTVSDRCFAGVREDLSGPILKRMVEQRGWNVAHLSIVPDEKREIEKSLLHLCDESGIRLILTTGGTGIGPRDVTPEATRAVLDKELPGLCERMRQEGFKHAPSATLSRAMAGTRGHGLIINLPGSPAGAEESLAAVIDLVPHAIAMLEGEGHESKERTHDAS